MHKIITLTILTCISGINNLNAMMTTINQENVQKAQKLETAMLNKPWCSFELIQTYLEEHIHEINTIEPSTGNTLLHEDVIEFCWGEKTGRFLRIAALLACGAHRNVKNLEGLSPIECAQEAQNQAIIDLLNIPTPTKQTVIDLATKHKLATLRPLLFEQQ